MAQCSHRRRWLAGVSRQSQRPDSEQATVSRPAEQRLGSRLVVDGAFELVEAASDRPESRLLPAMTFGPRLDRLRATDFG
jgi:hypothetical protein